MKKLISLILCIVFVCLALVSCKQEKIGEYLSNYQNDDSGDDKIEKLNFYIITGDNTSEQAMITVPQNINTYIKEKYKVELNIQYFKASEYQAAVTAAMNTDVEANRPDIILINSASMFDGLKSSLVPLNTDAFNFFAEDYKKLNTIVDKVLLDASAENGVYYTVPNNHCIGNYEYVVFEKDLAINGLRYRTEFAIDNPAKLVTNVNTDEAVDKYKSEILAYDSGYNVDNYIKVISDGKYEDYETLKYMDLETGVIGTEEVNFVNIKAYPNATREEAHSSAFAVVKLLSDDGEYKTKTREELSLLKAHYSKRMKVIYALNDDPVLINMLQYGYVGTNYVFDTNSGADNVIELINDASVRYEMNPIYTGNCFNTGVYFCEELGWTKSTFENWSMQIADAQLPANKLSSEYAKLTLNDKSIGSSISVASGDEFAVPTHGSYYSDVNIAWTTENANVTIDNTTGKIIFASVSEKTVVEIKVTLTCYGLELEKTFQVTINKPEG